MPVDLRVGTPHEGMNVTPKPEQEQEQDFLQRLGVGCITRDPSSKVKKPLITVGEAVQKPPLSLVVLPSFVRWSSIVKILMHPIGQQYIYPRLYFSASNEIFVFTLILTWAITLATHPDQIFKHPFRPFIGSLNPWCGSHLNSGPHIDLLIPPCALLSALAGTTRQRRTSRSLCAAATCTFAGRTPN